MRRICLVISAFAMLALATPADASTTINYSFSGGATGTMTLSLTGTTYTLTSLDLTFGTADTFTQANSSIGVSGSNLLLGADVGGYDSFSSADDDFLLSFNPSATSQTSSRGWAMRRFSCCDRSHARSNAR